MPRPQLLAVKTKANFKREVHKSFSYRYQVSEAAGPQGGPQVRSVIETRYRGKSASWTIKKSMMSEEAWTLKGTFIAPLPENPLAYPPGVFGGDTAERAVRAAIEAPAPSVTPRPAAAAPPRRAAQPAPSSTSVNAPASRAPGAAPRPQPTPRPAPRTASKHTIQRADPAEPPNLALERLYSFGRKLVTPPRKV